jgi:hypothetical protein
MTFLWICIHWTTVTATKCCPSNPFPTNSISSSQHVHNNWKSMLSVHVPEVWSGLWSKCTHYRCRDPGLFKKGNLELTDTLRVFAACLLGFLEPLVGCISLVLPARLKTTVTMHSSLILFLVTHWHFNVCTVSIEVTHPLPCGIISSCMYALDEGN